MASIRSPKSVFLSHGKVRQGLATLMEAPVNQLRFKVLCKFRERFEAAEFVRTCQKTGPCFILIQKPSSSKVLGGFTRTGWGTQYGTKHVDLEAFLFFCSSDFAPESVSKYLPMLRKLPHIPFPNVLWQQGGPAFNDDLVVREGGVSSRQQTYHITSEFIQEANTGGSAPLRWKSWQSGTVPGEHQRALSTGVTDGRTTSGKMHGCQAYHGMRRYSAWSAHISPGQDCQAPRVLWFSGKLCKSAKLCLSICALKSKVSLAVL